MWAGTSVLGPLMWSGRCNYVRAALSPDSMLSTPVSLDSVLGDVRSLQRGLELTQREFVRQDDCLVLKEFLRTNSPIMDKLLADSKTAQVGGWGGQRSTSH